VPSPRFVTNLLFGHLHGPIVNTRGLLRRHGDGPARHVRAAAGPRPRPAGAPRPRRRPRPRKSSQILAAHRVGEVARGSARASPVARSRGRRPTPRSSVLRPGAEVGAPLVFCASKLPSFLARWRVRGPAGTGSVGDGGGEGVLVYLGANSQRVSAAALLPCGQASF